MGDFFFFVFGLPPPWGLVYSRENLHKWEEKPLMWERRLDMREEVATDVHTLGSQVRIATP